ncbi:hypothetical protein [Nocardioides sp. URHA0020]|uniref:hypothetical protein n=1 Tax=Nocardioides sp. URHA0020 TaxID=1380392 RepID=UPI00048E77CD|nr:hypothetical protein [Nocardioides sp. URHA0020]
MPRPRSLLVLPALALTAVLAAGCAGADTGASGAAPVAGAGSRLPSAPGTSPGVIGADGGPIQASPGTGSLGPGFVTPSAPPAPGGTLTPSPHSWSGVTVPSGYSVALLSTDDSVSARRLATAVRTWAAANKVSVHPVPAHDPGNYLPAIQAAIDLEPDLVISTGDALADPLALVTSSWLDQKFLLLGAELAEPTANVTAAVWKGTTARGGGSGTEPLSDASTFTVERARRGLEAGVAGILRGYSGYVVKVG